MADHPFLLSPSAVAPPRTAPVRRPTALVVGAHDASGADGTGAMAAALDALGVHAAAALTATVAAGPRRARSIWPLPEAALRAQIEAVTAELSPAALLTGLFGAEAHVGALLELLDDRPIASIVVDPAFILRGTERWCSPQVREYVARRLFERATIVTPSRAEARLITGRPAEGINAAKDAAKRIFDLGPRYVVVTGGQADERVARDLVYDGTGFVEFGGDRIERRRLLGAGAAHAAAIAARLALGDEPLAACEFARTLIDDAIERAAPLGDAHAADVLARLRPA